MGFLVSPGVEVNEIDLTNVIPALATSVGGYAGRFSWGPDGELVTVSSEKDLVKIFGAPSSATSPEITRSFLTAASFLKYGNNLKVSRAVAADTVAAKVLYSSLPLVTAKYKGAFGNDLQVIFLNNANFVFPENDKWLKEFDYAPATTEWAQDLTVTTQEINDEIHILIVDAGGKFSGKIGTILEKYQGLSLAINAKNAIGGSNYYKDVVNNNSAYVELDYYGQITTSETSEITLNSNSTALTFVDPGLDWYTTSAGSDGTMVAGDVETAINLFENPEDVDVNFVFAEADDLASNTIAVKLVELGLSRKDIITFISPPALSTITAATAITWFDELNTSNYSVLLSSPVYVYNKYADSFVWISSAGHGAGLCANTDLVSEPWFSPAGLNRGQLRGVTKLAYNPTQAQRDDLYKVAINPIVSFPGQGIVLYGDKTATKKPSAFDRINVRRLFITLQKAIATAAKFQLFELNDDFTRAAFKNTVEPFLRDVQGRRGITDFRVVCDTTNNTGDVIDSNRFVADIYIKPSRSINYISLNFIATRTGVEFKEVIGE